MALAMEREQTACRSLLMLAGTVVAHPKRMLSRLVRDFITLAFTACILAVARSHRLADTVKGGERMALAMQRQPTAYRSRMMLAGTVLAEPKPMLSRLVRGSIALAVTACVLAVARTHSLVDTVKSGELRYMALAMQACNGTCNASQLRTARY